MSRNAEIFHSLGWLLLFLTLAMTVPLIAAAIGGEAGVIPAFSISMLLTGFVGLTLLIAYRNGGMEGREGVGAGLGFILLAWLVLPLFAALPLAPLPGYQTLLEAWVATAAALTTTDGIIPERLSDSLVVKLWLAELQWLGGLLFILIAASVFTFHGETGLPVRMPRQPAIGRFTRSKSVFAKFWQNAPVVAILYGIMTGIFFVAIALTGVPAYDALVLAFSSISTGGIVPRADGIASYDAPFLPFVLCVIMILASLNFLFHWSLLKGKWRIFLTDQETWNFAFFLALVGGGVWVLGWKMDVSELGTAFFDTISLMTTTGYYLDLSGSHLPSLAGVLFPVLIGGAAISTTGGLKVSRVALLLRQSKRELERLSHPNSISPIRYNDIRVSLETHGAIWALFIGYLVMVSSAALVVASAGYDFDASVSAAMASLTNAGPLLTIATSGAIGYDDFPAYVKAYLALTMIIGRLEVLAFFALAISFFKGVRRAI